MEFILKFKLYTIVLYFKLSLFESGLQLGSHQIDESGMGDSEYR